MKNTDHFFKNNSLQSRLLLTIGLSGILIILYWIFFKYKGLIPYTSSIHGKTIDKIFYVTLALTSIIFVLTQFLLFYLSFRYRADGRRTAFYLKDNIKIELIWTLIPAITFVFLFAWGEVLWRKIHLNPEPNPLEIEVFAQQFNWRFRYPGKDGKLGSSNHILINEVNCLGLDFRDKRNYDDIQPLQLHIPKNREVKIVLRSRDVIHSFFIPHMKVKMDALPGMHTQIRFTATHSTEEMREHYNNPGFNYEIACAELCGRMHFAMQMILIVDEEAEFQKWYKSQLPWLKEHPEFNYSNLQNNL